MKRNRKTIIILLLSILLIFQGTIVAFARSGGGGSSSGGSGGGGSSHSSSSHSSSSRRTDNPITSILGTLFIVSLWKIDVIIREVQLINKKQQAGSFIKRLRNIDNSYSKDMLQDRVRETYFKMQEAWTNMDTEISKEYMSEDIYNLHSTKLEWMKIRNRRNVLSNIKLLSSKPIGIEHYSNNSKDSVWFYIKGSMIDYILNGETNEVIEGNTRNKSFIEFWKFKKLNNKWVVDKILQKEDVNIKLDFNIVSEE